MHALFRVFGRTFIDLAQRRYQQRKTCRHYGSFPKDAQKLERRLREANDVRALLRPKYVGEG